MSDRKGQPLFAGCLNYFPDALLAVARLSRIGNDKHNPGEPLHWSKDKSNDHADCLARHLLTNGEIDPDTGLSHTVAVAWRALALLQTEIEAQRAGTAAPTDRRARVYIAGPMSKGSLQHNITQANEAFRLLAGAGLAPFCPHWSAYSGEVYRTHAAVWAFATATGNGMSHAEWLAVDLPWVAAADAVLRLPGDSPGADQETAEARRLGIPVFNSIPAVIEWANASRP